MEVTWWVKGVCEDEEERKKDKKEGRKVEASRPSSDHVSVTASGSRVSQATRAKAP